MEPALGWRDGSPYSARFDDVYFSVEDGLAESRAVFLSGCGLPDAWAAGRRFVVGELGFGTGLNVLALLDLWRRTRAADAHLSIFSIERDPLAREDAERALAAWPELGDVAAALLDQWPDARAGFHRVDFAEHAATLDLWIGEAAAGLRAWGGMADAWFLDGFAPSKNPEMWRQDLLALVAARSAPGARLATFTVAGSVRRSLAAAGFTVERRPGFGRKRERLEARLPGAPPSDEPVGQVAILGAGIAGAALVRAFARLGCPAVLVEPDAPGAGASGNPAALVTPRLDAGFGPAAALHAAAFARAVALYRRETPEAVIAEGALQLERAPRDAARFAHIAGWSGFAPGGMQTLAPEAAAELLDERDATAALLIRDALVVEPARILGAWVDGRPLIRAEAAALACRGGRWRIEDEAGALIAEADAVCLAAGPASARLARVPLAPVRGQASYTRTVSFSGEPAAWGGYAIPLAGGGVLFGASHRREDCGTEARVSEARDNLDRLAEGRPRLAARVRPAGHEVEQRASLRAASPDHRPLAGGVPGERGLYVLSGLGGRGFTLAPLLAEHVAALATGAPSPLAADQAEAVDPARFSARSGTAAPDENR